MFYNEQWRKGCRETLRISLLPSGASFINEGGITQISDMLEQSNKAATYDS
jgi:hypothetical protein